MRILLSLAWRDLRASGRSLWIFSACLILGVALIAASGSLYRLVSNSLLADTRQLLGGDLQVDSTQPLPTEALEWMQQRGRVSLLTELYTMLGTEQDDFIRVELQSVDGLYPLYGELKLEPDGSLTDILSEQQGRWGVAIDQSLALRYQLKVGDPVYIGTLVMQVRAIILQQPDRNLSADWRGAPVLISPLAIQQAELIQPGSRVDYDYRVATELTAADWKSRFYQRFPDRGWQVRTFKGRGQRIAERLDQIASGLLIIGFSTLFIGGLGVFSSIRAYLQGKRKTIATLRAVGLRNHRIAIVYFLQVALLGGASSLLGCLLGAVLALLGASVLVSEMAFTSTLAVLPTPLFSAFAFGLLCAFCFALPALGGALSVSPTSLFRDLGRDPGNTANRLPLRWQAATLLCAAMIIGLVLFAVPSMLFGAIFIGVIALLLVLLELILRLIRYLAKAAEKSQGSSSGLALRLALANLHQPATPLRSALLSLGSALTLLVICTLVVVSLVREIQATIPQNSPDLVLYDISPHQRPVVEELLGNTSASRLELVPLVRSRINAVNGRAVADLLLDAPKFMHDVLNAEHKLSYRGGNIDAIELVEGAWWSAPQTLPNLSLEDREARRLGVSAGDTISYQINGESIQFNIAAIHKQKGMQTRFWFEVIVSDGLLDPAINRYVGAAWLDDDQVIEAQRQIAAAAPNAITVRTKRILATASDILGQATSGLAVVATISMLASLLVLFSVIAAGRARQVYSASVLNALGVRLSVIRNSLYLEFLLIALVTAVFASALGSLIALPLLEWRLKIPAVDLIWLGLLTSIAVSISTLLAGAQYMHRRLSVQPVVLLRNAG